MNALLEAAAALAISGAVMMLVSSSMSSALAIHAACSGLENELFRIRQLEHLADRAVLAAGAGPVHPPAISSLTGDTVVFGSDQDGNGTVDATSSETTALEVRQASGQARVRIRLGRQTMSVVEADKSTATLETFDRFGNSGGAATTTLIALSIDASDVSPGATARALLFSVPSRILP